MKCNAPYKISELTSQRVSDSFSHRCLTVNLTRLECDRFIKVYNPGAFPGIYQQINQEYCGECTLQYRRSHALFTKRTDAISTWSI